MTAAAQPTPQPADSKDGMGAAIDVLESATALLRGTRAADWIYYYLGTLPFLWYFVWFWAEMSRSAQAHNRLWPSALTLSLTYVWMKIGQTLFVQRLLLVLRNESRRWTLREIARMVRRAATIQSSALTVTGFAACLLIPSAWTIAFYHHAQSACDPEQKDALACMRKALRQSQLWPRQNHALLSLHAAFGLVVCFNVWATMILLPQLLLSLFGVQTRYLPLATSPFNSTLIAAAIATTVALADPWLKAAYAVRAFRVESITTGRDLSVAWHKALREKSVGIWLLVLISILPIPAFATDLQQTENIELQPTDASPQAEAATAREAARSQSPTTVTIRPDCPPGAAARQLDQKLDEVLERPAFAFRMPREGAEEARAEEPSWLRAWLVDTLHPLWGYLKTAVGWIVKAIGWLLNPGDPVTNPSANNVGIWSRVADRGTVLLAVLAVALPLIVLLRRRWRARLAAMSPKISPPYEATEDNEAIEAAKRPESEWLQEAERLLLAGDRRMALRAMFLANLACLIQAGHIVALAHKSVGDYRRDLERRAHAHPGAYQGYCATARIFESVWYGSHPVTDESVEQFSVGSALLRQNA